MLSWNILKIMAQWKMLNLIILEQRETDNINQMITMAGYFYIVVYFMLLDWAS